MPWQPKRDHPVTRVFFLFFGLAALGVCAWQTRLLVHLLRNGVRVTGHVAARSGEPDARDSGAHPDIQFSDQAGITVRFNQNGMGSRPVGAPVRVLYDPAAPAQTATVDAFLQLWYPVLIPFVFGSVATVASVTGEFVPARGSFRGA